MDLDRSVTCALCGKLADERETISLWEDDYDNPAKVARVAEMPNGEAHPGCFGKNCNDPEGSDE